MSILRERILIMRLSEESKKLGKDIIVAVIKGYFGVFIYTSTILMILACIQYHLIFNYLGYVLLIYLTYEIIIYANSKIIKLVKFIKGKIKEKR